MIISVQLPNVELKVTIISWNLRTEGINQKVYSEITARGAYGIYTLLPPIDDSLDCYSSIGSLSSRWVPSIVSMHGHVYTAL